MFHFLLAWSAAVKGSLTFSLLSVLLFLIGCPKDFFALKSTSLTKICLRLDVLDLFSQVMRLFSVHYCLFKNCFWLLQSWITEVTGSSIDFQYCSVYCFYFFLWELLLYLSGSSLSVFCVIFQSFLTSAFLFGLTFFSSFSSLCPLRRWIYSFCFLI